LDINLTAYIEPTVHFLGLALRAPGHEVRLMPAQYVTPYVKTSKNHSIDAEAVQCPRMCFVPIQRAEQLDLQALHRVRERWVMRTGGKKAPFR
jgi:transposase